MDPIYLDLDLEPETHVQSWGDVRIVAGTMLGHRRRAAMRGSSGEQQQEAAAMT